jgi:uncharacterized protein
LVIYHGNCADGFAAAWCFRRKFGDRADYHAAQHYQDPPPVALREFYLVDFSYKRVLVATMIAEARSVTLIDHHQTALQDLAGLQGLRTYTDLNRSGARLAWDFLFPDEQPPLLLGHIQDRDLYQFKLAGTAELSALVHSHPYQFEVWDQFMGADAVELAKLAAAGAGILRKHHKDLAELISTCKRRVTIAGHDVPVANLPSFMASDGGHEMAKDEAFAACYWDTAQARMFELRSSPTGLDVSAIALQFGGGHLHAAGFRVPRNHPLALV